MATLHASPKHRLVHVTTIPWSFFFVRDQARYMQERGFDVTAIASPGRGLLEFGESEGVATRDVRMLRAISPIQDLRSIVRMCMAFRDVRPTIVHAHSPKAGLVSMISALITRTPVRIYHIRGLPYMTATGMRRRLMRWSEKISCMLAHEVFCVSHSIKAFAVEDGLAPQDKITVFLGGSGNGVDATARFSPESFTETDRSTLRASLGIESADRVIGFVGRLVRDKGAEDLASAWRVLRDRYPDAHLVMVGLAETKDAISPETMAALTTDPRVHVMGELPDSSPYFSIFDLVVLPSYREGFPNVLLEAASMRLPVVATRIPGCTDAVVDGVTGTLVDTGNVEALTAAIERYLNDPDLREAHGVAGRERVLREFRREDIWEAIYREYVRLLQSHGIGVPASASQPIAERSWHEAPSPDD